MLEKNDFVAMCSEIISAIEEDFKNNPYGFASIIWKEEADSDIISWVRDFFVELGFTNVFQTADRRIIAY